MTPVTDRSAEQRDEDPPDLPIALFLLRECRKYVRALEAEKKP